MELLSFYSAGRWFYPPFSTCQTWVCERAGGRNETTLESRWFDLIVLHMYDSMSVLAMKSSFVFCVWRISSEVGFKPHLSRLPNTAYTYWSDNHVIHWIVYRSWRTKRVSIGHLVLKGLWAVLFSHLVQLSGRSPTQLISCGKIEKSKETDGSHRSGVLTVMRSPFRIIRAVQ